MNKFKKSVVRSFIYLLSIILIGQVQLNASNVVQASWGGWGYYPGWSARSTTSVESACRVLISEGLTPVSASGVIGNFMSESGMNPYMREAVGNHATYWSKDAADRLDPDFDTFGPGRGLAQWGDGSGVGGLGGSRWLSLIRYVNTKYNKTYPERPTSSWNNAGDSAEATVRAKWPTLEEQLSFVKQELFENSQGISLATFNTADTPENAAYTFAVKYERPAAKTLADTLALRKSEARKAYDTYCSKISTSQPTPITPEQPKVTLKDGDYFQVIESGEVYILAGGAPMYVTDWTHVGGMYNKTLYQVSQAQVNNLRKMPVDGTYVLAGNDVFVFIGGAPIYVSSWQNVGGYKPYIVIDRTTINNAGGVGKFSYMMKTPIDGTAVLAGFDVYVFAGGAPLYVGDWNRIGGVKSFTRIDEVAIQNAGQGGVFNAIQKYPVNDTYVLAGGDVYGFVGGAPIYVASWSRVGGVRPVTMVDVETLNRSERSGKFSNTRQYPIDGTCVSAGNDVFIFAGGAPMYVSDWNRIGGMRPTQMIDRVAIDNAGQNGVYRHIQNTPVDGTFVLAGNDVFMFQQGRAIHVKDWRDVGGMRPYTVIDRIVIDNAGGSGIFSHIRKS